MRAKNTMQLRHHIPHLLFLTSGIAGMLFFSTIDFIRPGKPHFGTDQLAGLVISSIIVLACMRKPTSPHAKRWFGTLLLIYLLGILFMGLKPSGDFHNYAEGLLVISKPIMGDSIINILGFVPFAYLFMAYLFSERRATRTFMPVLLVLISGTGISLFIELVQYYIPGRTSSMMDLIANTVGTLIGIVYFIVENRLLPLRP